MEANTKAENLIAACGGTGSDSLDLSQLELDHIPESVRRLKWLQELDLQNNRIENIPDRIGELQNLSL